MPAAALWARLEIVDTDLNGPEPDQYSATEPLPSDAIGPGDEADPIGSVIASAIDAATPSGYTESVGEVNGIEEFAPYGHQERVVGHGIEW
jgi:hypothetical protein